MNNVKKISKWRRGRQQESGVRPSYIIIPGILQAAYESIIKISGRRNSDILMYDMYMYLYISYIN